MNDGDFSYRPASIVADRNVVRVKISVFDLPKNTFRVIEYWFGQICLARIGRSWFTQGWTSLKQAFVKSPSSANARECFLSWPSQFSPDWRTSGSGSIIHDPIKFKRLLCATRGSRIFPMPSASPSRKFISKRNTKKLKCPKNPQRINFVSNYCLPSLRESELEMPESRSSATIAKSLFGGSLSEFSWNKRSCSSVCSTSFTQR